MIKLFVSSSGTKSDKPFAIMTIVNDLTDETKEYSCTLRAFTKPDGTVHYRGELTLMRGQK